MDEWMDRWENGQVGRWRNGEVDKWKDAYSDEWMSGCLNMRDGWVYGRLVYGNYTSMSSEGHFPKSLSSL